MTKGRLTVLKLEIRPGESISIGNYAVVTLEEKSGKIARLAIQADKSVPVSRIQSQNTATIAASVGITGKP
jgi:sRNA-binding carbon storage regulator CsrA